MKRYSTGILIVLLILSSFIMLPPVSQTHAQPESWMLIERGSNYELYRSGSLYKWVSAPQWIWNGSYYVPYIYIRDDAKKCYRVQTAFIAGEIYDSGVAVFYNPNVTEQRVKSEQWEVWKWDGSNWKIAALGTPSFSVIQNSSGIFITLQRATSKPSGTLTVGYTFIVGEPLKHWVYWKNAETLSQTVQIKQIWDLASSIEKCQVDGLETSVSGYYKNKTFLFYNTTNPFLVLEDQSSMFDKLEPVSLDFAGKKAIYTFSNWTLASGQSLTIDPTTLTATPPTKDSQVSQSYPNNNYGSTTIITVSSYNIGETNRRILVEFDISSIPAGAVISSAVLKLYAASVTSGRTYNINRVAGSWTESGVTWNNQPSVDSTTLSPSCPSPVGWWENEVASIFVAGSTIGFRVKDSVENAGTEYVTQFYSKEYTGTTYDPVLSVLYNVCEPTKDSYISSSAPTGNWGTDTTMYVLSYGGTGDLRSLVEFNTSSIPSNAVVSSAVVKLYVDATSASGRTYQFSRITGSWTETGVTWNNKPATTGLVSASAPSATGWWSVNVASIFVVGSTIGFRIKDSVEGSGTPYQTNFRTREYAEKRYDPYLEVTYTNPPTIGQFQAPSTVYANKYFLLNATIKDADGIATFINATVEISNSVILKWVNSTNTFSKYQDTNGYCTLDAANSLRTSVNSTAYKLSWKIKLTWTYPEGSVDVVVTNTKAFSTDGSGSNSKTGLFTFEDDLIVYSASVNDARVNPSDPLTFTGQVYYEGTTTPPEISTSSVVGTSTVSTATQAGYQHKSFYHNGLFWLFYFDGANMIFRTSSNGLSWSSATTVRACTSSVDFDVYFDGAFIHYCYSSGAAGGAIFYRRGVPNSNGTITWSASEQTAEPLKTGVVHAGISMSVDSNGCPFIAWRNSTATTYYPWVTRSSENSGTWVTASGFPYKLSTQQLSNLRTSTISLTSGRMYVLYYVTKLYGRLWDGSSWNTEETATASNLQVNYGFSVTSFGDDIHLVFLKQTSYNIVYVKRTYNAGWEAESTVQSGTTSTTASVVSVQETGDLYCFWSGSPSANNIYYKKCVSGTWDNDPTDWISEAALTANTILNCFSQSCGGYIGLAYMTETASPYNVKFALNLISRINLGNTLKGSSPINPDGTFNIKFNAESNIAQHSYTVYAVTPDQNSVQNQTVNVIVDNLVVSGKGATDSRTNINEYEQYWFTLRSQYDSAAVQSGTVTLNGTLSASWISARSRWEYNTTKSSVQSQALYVASVSWSTYGITSLSSQTSNSTAIIWDNIVVTDKGATDSRTNIYEYEQYWFKFRSQYDSALVQSGTVVLNGSLSATWAPARSRWEYNVTKAMAQKQALYASSVNWDAYGITSLSDQSSNSTTIIWDRVQATVSVSDSRINIGENGSIIVSGTYEYDSVAFSGSFTLNSTQYLYATAGKRGYKVQSISDSLYGLTAFTTNEAYVIWDGLKVDDYNIDVANAEVYARMKYAYDGSTISGGTVALAEKTANTNSTGWANFDFSTGSDFSWSQTAYGTTDGTYGITYKALNQTLPIAKKTRFIQSDAEISSLAWDGVKLTVGFASTGTWTLKCFGSQPVYVKGVDYDLSTDYTTYLTLSHTGERDITVAWSTWGDFYIRSLSKGWMTDIYWTDQKLTIVLNGTAGQSGTLTVYCGDRGMPKSTSGFSAMPEYNSGTKILSGQYSFASEVTITLDFTMPVGGGGGGGGPTPAVTFIVGTLLFETSPGMTVDATLNFTWIGTNEVTITNIRFSGVAVGWLTLAETLPKTVTKEISAREGYGEIGIRVLVPSDAPLGEYTVPAVVEADAVGIKVTTGGWITFTLVKPTPPATTVPDYMTYIFAALLLLLIAYAYLKH